MWIFAAQSGAWRPSGRRTSWKRSTRSHQRVSWSASGSAYRPRSKWVMTSTQRAKTSRYARLAARSRGASSATVVGATPAMSRNHFGSRTSRPQRIATPSVRQRCIVRKQPRQVAPDALEVDGVPELVEHRLGPALARRVVAEHPHVAGAVDVDAERVLHLARPGREVAAADDALARRGPSRRTCGPSALRGRRRADTGRGRRRPRRARPGRTDRRSATVAARRRGRRSASPAARRARPSARGTARP